MANERSAIFLLFMCSMDLYRKAYYINAFFYVEFYWVSPFTRSNLFMCIACIIRSCSVKAIIPVSKSFFSFECSPLSALNLSRIERKSTYLAYEVESEFASARSRRTWNAESLVKPINKCTFAASTNQSLVII